MKLIPSHDFEIQSRLSASAAFNAMAAHVEPVNPYRVTVTVGFWTVIGDKGPKAFEGAANGSGFSVRRLVGFHSYFAPHTEIAINPRGSVSIVSVSLRLPALAYVVFALPLLVLLSNGATVTSLVMGALMFGLFYAFVAGGFWFEAQHQERVLRDIFQGA